MKWLVVALIGIAVIAAAYTVLVAATPGAPEQVDYGSVEYGKDYTSETFGFSLRMPGDFESRVFIEPETGITSILLESSTREDGVQILVTPFDEDIRELTAARIQSDVPELRIEDPQPVEIGLNYKGLAFQSDNEAFDGASREVWFVFRGHLYQISTYNRLDPLLKNIFATWEFI